MRLFLHICCGPCLARALPRLRADGGGGLALRGLFHNPNIHPLLEARRRLKALRLYLERDPVPVRADTRYGLADFLRATRKVEDVRPGNGNPEPSSAMEVPPASRNPLVEEEKGPLAAAAACPAFGPDYARPERCRRCYALRFAEAARVARTEGADALTTSLFASREQDHDALREEGERAARAQGLRFVVFDARDVEPPEKLVRGLYRQSYCGCVFSEAERYAGTGQRL